MTNSITLYQMSTIGKVKEWTLSLSGNVITTTWGFVDGAKQTTTDIIYGKNEGRANATSDEEQAALEFDRKIKEKKHTGLVESIEDAKSSVTLSEDFFTSPPSSFSLPKPQNSISDKKKSSETFIIQRKLDGCRAHTFIDSRNKVQIYSRTMKEVKTNHFPQISSTIESLSLSLSVLDGEMAVINNGLDDYDLMKSIWGSDVDKALEKSEGVNVVYTLFDLPFFEGEDLLASTSYEERHSLLVKLIPKDFPFIKVIDKLNMSLAEAEALARRSNWEGLVLWNPSSKHEGAWTLNGKPKRPKDYCYKNKVKQDYDVVVEEWEYGRGKNKDVLGKWINAYMLCPKTDKKIKVGSVGGGLSDEQRKEFTAASYPIVIKVECDKMNPSGALRYPVFKSVHEAKTPEECYMDLELFDTLTDVTYLE